MKPTLVRTNVTRTVTLEPGLRGAVAWRRWLLALLALLALTATRPVRAGEVEDPFFLYTLNDSGRVSLWGTLLEKLPAMNSGFAGGTGLAPRSWIDLLVSGSDRYVLHASGRVDRNGMQMFTLDTETDDPWIRMIKNGSSLTALSLRGRVALGESVTSALVADDGLFIDMAYVNGTLVALRTDGGLLRIGDKAPVVDLDGGPGLSGAADGAAEDTSWLRLRADGGSLYGLRADGLVYCIDGLGFGGAEGVAVDLVAELPLTPPLLDNGRLYVDMELDDLGNWYVMRRDGALFDASHMVTPLQGAATGGVFPPGSLDQPASLPSTASNPFVDLAVAGDEQLRLRLGGQLLTGASNDTVIKLVSNFYTRMAIGDTTPDLSGVENTRPVVSRYKTRAYEGDDVSVPVLVSDVDQPVEEDVLTLDLEDLDGATYDTETGLVSWPAGAQPGKYRFRLTVDDGNENKPKTYVYKIRVLARADSAKNKKPKVSKVKRVQALIGQQIVVPVRATDNEGDPLTIMPANDKGAFARGAVYDEASMSVVWTPSNVDLGVHKALLKVSDGNKTVKLKLSFDVRFPLFAVEDDPPPKGMLQLSGERPPVTSAGTQAARGGKVTGSPPGP